MARTAAERLLRAGYEAFEQAQKGTGYSIVASMLAQAVYSMGRYEEAERLSAVGEKHGPAFDMRCQIKWRSGPCQMPGAPGREGRSRASRPRRGQPWSDHRLHRLPCRRAV
jgi:hypothetical protein